MKLLARLARPFRVLARVGPRRLFWRFARRLLRSSGLDRVFSPEARAKAPPRPKERKPFLPGASCDYGSFAKESGAKDRLVRAARAVERGKVRVFGKTVEFKDSPDWSRAPGTDQSWERVHWTKLKLDARAPGDARLNWELNRCAFFLILARAYRLTGNERFLERLKALLASWTDANPPGTGIAWVSSVEVAVRATNWVLALDIAQSEELDEAARPTVAAFAARLRRECKWARRTGNELEYLGVLAGLACAADWLGKDSELRRARGRFWKALRGVKGSVSFLRFAAELGLLMLVVDRARGFSTPQGGVEELGRMLKVLASLAPHFTAVTVGDSDGGRAYSLCEKDARDLRPVLAAGAALLKDAELKAGSTVRGAPDLEEAFWLAGDEGVRTFAGLQAAKAEPFVSLPDEGFYLLRTKELSLLVRCGGHGPRAHADQLSFSLEGDGPLIADGGTFLLFDEKWREHFRSTFAHSTVVVDGESQALPRGSFDWLGEVRGKVLRAEARRLVCEHSGYARLDVVHTREFLFLDDRTLIVADVVAGKGVHLADLRFQLAASDYKQYGSVIKSGDLRLALLWPLDADVEVSVGAEGGGWVSRRYGEKEPAALVSIAQQGGLPLAFVSVLALDDDIKGTAEFDPMGGFVVKVEGKGEARVLAE